MKWQHPFLLVLFLIAPFLIALFFYASRLRQERIQLFGSELFQEKVKKGVHWKRRWFKIFLVMTSLLLLVVALASPQVPGKVKIKKKLGSEFFLALDTSLSMMAQDETPNRLHKAKEEILALLEKLEGYRVGLIIFAGTSFVQCPLTMDHTAIRNLLETVNTESLPVPGSAFKKVIENGRKSFGEEKGARKYLVLFTDGEDLEGEDPMGEVREAAREGITLFGIGFGSPSGSPIPLYEKGVMTGYKKDMNGVTVATHLDEPFLTEIAHATRGRYYKATSDFTELDELLGMVAKHGKKETSEQTETQYESRYQIPLFLAVFFLTIELAISEIRKNFEQ